MSTKSKWSIFGFTSIANLVCAFSINSMNLALPTIAAEYGVSMSQVSWLTLVYSLVPCCTLLIFGRLGDLYGYKKQFIVGFAFFGSVSLLAPIVSFNLGMLIFMRCLLGLGYSIMISISQAIISKTFESSGRGKALGLNSVFVSVGFASGPTIGGVLIQYINWKAIFWFNVPFCILGIIVTMMVLENDSKIRSADKKMDWAGGALFAAAIGFLMVGLNFSNKWGWLSSSFLGCMAIFAISLILFILCERRVKSPLMRMELFKRKSFSLANGAIVCNYCTQQMTTFLVPFYLITVLSIKSDLSGVIMLTSPLTMLLSSPYGGALTDKYGTRRPASIGLCIIIAGSAFMSMLHETSSILPVVATLALLGVGNGLSVSSVNTSVFSSVQTEHSGIASSMVGTMRTLGQALGVAGGNVIIASRQAAYSADAILTSTEAYLLAQRDAFYFGILVTCAALFLVFKLPAHKPQY